MGYGVRFRDKVWPGDKLVLRAEPAGEAGRYTLTASRAADGVVVLSGWAGVQPLASSAASGTRASASAIRSS